ADQRILLARVEARTLGVALLLVFGREREKAVVIDQRHAGPAGKYRHLAVLAIARDVGWHSDRKACRRRIGWHGVGGVAIAVGRRQRSAAIGLAQANVDDAGDGV